MNQVTMIQIVSNSVSLVNNKEHMSSTNKGAGTYNSKKGCCMNGKKIWKSLLGKNYHFGKPVHFSIKNTANNADT